MNIEQRISEAVIIFKEESGLDANFIRMSEESVTELKEHFSKFVGSKSVKETLTNVNFPMNGVGRLEIIVDTELKSGFTVGKESLFS